MTCGAVGPIAQPRSLPRCRGVITSGETSSDLSALRRETSNATHARVFAIFIYSRCVRWFEWQTDCRRWPACGRKHSETI